MKPLSGVQTARFTLSRAEISFFGQTFAFNPLWAFAAGTSALAVLISMILSILNFMIKGVTVYWVMIGVELVGIFIGSMIGPRTGKYIPEKGLKWVFIILAIYVGLDYALRGFFNFRLVD